MSEVLETSTPWRRDPDEIATRLAQWARFARSGATVTDVRAPGSGMANDTVLFRLDGEPLVARLAPSPDAPFPTFPTFDLDLQRQVIELVRRRTDVPVPEIVHVEPMDDALGVPFMVMRAIEGVVPSDSPPYLLDPDGWFLQGTPDDWKRMETATIGVLAELHTIVDDEETAFLHLDVPGSTPLARQIAAHREYYAWACEGIRIPVLDRALDVLTATEPATGRCVLNWGDSRPGNIIYRDFEPVAVLDWEMAMVGPPEVDVAWMTFFQRFFAGMAEQYGLPPVPAMFDPEETAATYERLSGVRLDDLAWYEALAGLWFGIILARMSLRASAFGAQPRPDDPDDLIMFAPLLGRLLDRV
jgi:aminoglycoside phosphotransferase (APT) family kinase protein